MNYFAIIIKPKPRISVYYIVRAEHAADALLAIFEMNDAANDTTRYDFDSLTIINYLTDVPAKLAASVQLTENVWHLENPYA